MADKKYVLMRWKDGWQEVVSVESDAVDLSKYYVIPMTPKSVRPGLCEIFHIDNRFAVF